MPVSTSTALVFRPGSQNGVLLACVLASILLHAAVLFLSPGIHRGAPTSGPRILTATFAPRLALPEPAPAAEERVNRPPEPRPEPPKREATPEVPRPVLARPGPSPVAVPQPAAVPVPSAPPAASTPSPPAPAAAQAQVPVTAEGAPSSDAGDAGLMEQYRVALIKEADRYKRYPAQAIERGWQGRVEVRLVIGANTFIKSATVRTSSGYAVLDDLALDMVRKGKPLVQIPAALRGREFTVDVPVIFSLRAG
jgi:periplasmic protein TonB